MKYTESDVTLVPFSSSGKSHWSDQTVTMTLTETLEMILENNCLQIVKDPYHSRSKSAEQGLYVREERIFGGQGMYNRETRFPRQVPQAFQYRHLGF